MIFCSINGKEVTSLSVNDRGLAYGDGLFTTAKIVNGQVELLGQHLNRLIKGCEFLGINIEHLGDIEHSIEIYARSYKLAVLKVIITAGSGGRGYSRINLDENASQLIIMVSDYPKHYDELVNTGMSLGVSKNALSVSPMLAGIKHLNRLEQVILRQELDLLPFDDLVVCNANNFVVETTCANIFYLDDQQWKTPDLSLSGVDGLMRQNIIKTIGDVKVTSTTLDELLCATEVFICNSIMGLMPVRCLKQRDLSMTQSKKIREQLLD